MTDRMRADLRLAGWAPLEEIENWRTAIDLVVYHPRWGAMTHIAPRDRFGLDPVDVWGYIRR
jgi:hypothetical protein